MTMWQHSLLGATIISILWHFWIHRYFYTEKNLSDIEDEINEWMR